LEYKTLLFEDCVPVEKISLKFQRPTAIKKTVKSFKKRKQESEKFKDVSAKKDMLPSNLPIRVFAAECEKVQHKP
jgi:hypothetical protein